MILSVEYIDKCFCVVALNIYLNQMSKNDKNEI